MDRNNIKIRCQGVSVKRFIRVFDRYMVACAISDCALFLAKAQTLTEVTRGLQWLSGQVQANGTFLNESQSIATPFQNRTEVTQTLKLLASIPSPLADNIVAETEGNTEYLARKVVNMTLAGRNVDTQVA